MYDIKSRGVRKTGYMIGISFCCIIGACKSKNKNDVDLDVWQQRLDVLANAQLDSIYKKQSMTCDSLQKMRIPQIVDSLIKDSGFIKQAIKKVNGYR